MLLLAVVATALGATALAYNVLDNARLTAIGVLVTFVLLVQFWQLPERPRGTLARRRGSAARAAAVARARVRATPPRGGRRRLRPHLRLVPHRVLPRHRRARDRVRAFDLPPGVSVPLATRYSLFVGLGVYRRVWRYATARDVVPIAVACFGSAVIAYLILISLRDIGDFPVEVFVVDAFLSTILVGASRLTLRLVPEARARRHGRRVLIVGAGRAGRGLARELHDTHEARVVGFLDDNPRSGGGGSRNHRRRRARRGTAGDRWSTRRRGARDDPRRAGGSAPARRAGRVGGRGTLQDREAPNRVHRARDRRGSPPVSVARLRLALLHGVGMRPPCAPFFRRAWGSSRFPTPLHAHRPGTDL